MKFDERQDLEGHEGVDEGLPAVVAVVALKSDLELSIQITSYYCMHITIISIFEVACNVVSFAVHKFYKSIFYGFEVLLSKKYDRPQIHTAAETTFGRTLNCGLL